MKLLSVYPEDLDDLPKSILGGMEEVDKKHNSIFKKLLTYLKYALFSIEESPSVISEDDADTNHFCTNCGESLIHQHDFCVNCGHQSSKSDK